MNPVQKFFVKQVPFAQTIGVTITQSSPGEACARLPFSPSNVNHVGTIHAGALFTLAESAAAASILSTFSDLVPHILLLVTKSSVEYSAPAQGDIVAIASISKETEQLVRNTLNQPGDRIRFTVHTEIKREGADEISALAQFEMYMKRNEVDRQ
ncbi:DUF4442 domain-containing protein [Brevibacillus laterosporus]|uniref:YiiD C-terminal domain-containing protein n=1 Tax=Brevibacillus TaxID=55080 RepID=UPI000839BE4D|nr:MULTISPECIES: YiiD C-terminal domain-containing protein [Brevibacillus]AUM66657.1 DUF4442 domain-containing protein [Brevibacillus laterosporus]MBA4532426.1 YiiD C-terminal domain-containing protein [Brevibacillus halotolerans]MCR8996644.1 DUF4442 domain-containing protein [Brevibacillus laterosporus]MDF9413291.1 DUF4442 domain-containing protein [Brevibacillus laterosporus]PCN42707.1 DUF4442 domain-containing protein [Brevibacillus laterosporus]